jgi:hypothetical protein
LIAQPRQVRVWAGQLQRNDFPPVCAMTGRPAEVWRKFTFSTPPAWTYALLLLVCLGGIGIIVFGIVVYAVSERASGHLPLTRQSNTIAALALWVPVGLLIAWPVSWVLGIILGNVSGDSSSFPIFFILGIFFLVAGLVGRLVATPLIAPRGKVQPLQPGYFDRLVEISNVSPVFAVAVHEMQQQRAGQSRPPAQQA